MLMNILKTFLGKMSHINFLYNIKTFVTVVHMYSKGNVKHAVMTSYTLYVLYQNRSNKADGM
jgi:hypothetical protein